MNVPVPFLECFHVQELKQKQHTVHSPSGISFVVSKRLPTVSIFTIVESVDSQVRTREDVLDQDDELLIHESSGWLN